MVWPQPTIFSGAGSSGLASTASPEVVKASRSSVSMRQGWPGVVKARPTEHSARPYTGDMEFLLNPCGENFCVKATIVSGLTGSAPLKAKRQDDRSRPSSSLSAVLLMDSSYEKFGPPEMVPRWRWMARIHE